MVDRLRIVENVDHLPNVHLIESPQVRGWEMNGIAGLLSSSVIVAQHLSQHHFGSPDHWSVLLRGFFGEQPRVVVTLFENVFVRRRAHLRSGWRQLRGLLEPPVEHARAHPLAIGARRDGLRVFTSDLKFSFGSHFMIRREQGPLTAAHFRTILQIGERAAAWHPSDSKVFALGLNGAGVSASNGNRCHLFFAPTPEACTALLQKRQWVLIGEGR